MANWTTQERRDVFLQYFTAEPAVSVNDYAIRHQPKKALYVRGIIKGTHYALETLDLAYGLFMRGGYDLKADFVAVKVDMTPEELDSVSARYQRMQLVIEWMNRINRLDTEIGIGKK